MPVDPMQFQDQGNPVLNIVELVRCCRAIAKRLIACEAKLLGLDKPDVDPSLKDLPAQVHTISDKLDGLVAQIDSIVKSEADTTLHDQVAKLQVKMDKLLPDNVDPTIPPDPEAPPPPSDQ